VQEWTARELVNAWLASRGDRTIRPATKVSLERLLKALKEYFPEL
jgi:hypothetical protein